MTICAFSYIFVFSCIIRAKTRLLYNISFYKQEFEQKTQLLYNISFFNQEFEQKTQLP